MRLAAPVSTLLERFHASKPVRAWSLIITLYGDAVVPRGGGLWLGSLTRIMALFGIDAGHVRTAMSRLGADGWLARERIGRNSYYRLSKRGEASFVAATRRIYLGEERRFDGKLRLALLGPQVDDRSSVRPSLERGGFVALAPTIHVALVDPPPDTVAFDGVFVITADAGDTGPAIAAAAWKLEPLAAAYRNFVERFTALDEALVAGQALDPENALVARVLLIHEFRRIVLRDPALPRALLPSPWPGAAARALTARIYRRVAEVAETYLDKHARNERGPLPAPDPNFFRRFEAGS
jgi:phenylacetic acid degradation operon negative regulatory protein